MGSLYPVFVHTYLQLVALGAAALAHTMMADYKSGYLTASTNLRQRKIRESELHDLLSLSTPEQLETSALASGLRAERTCVSLSQYGYDLLVNYLRQESMLLILGLINQWIQIEVVQGPTSTVDSEGLLSRARGDLDASVVNQTPLELRVLASSAWHRYEDLKAKQEEESVTDEGADENLTKKQKADLQRRIAAAKMRREEIGKNAVSGQIPLPGMADEDVKALIEDFVAGETAGAGALPVSADALPLALFITFANSQQSLNCATVNIDGRLVAAGFSDSSVRLFSLSHDNDHQEFDADDTQSKSSHSKLWAHSGPVSAVDFSPDSKFIVSSSIDGTVRLWSTELAASLVAYKGHMLSVWDVSFAPEFGHYFASCGADRTARIWTTERSQPVRIFPGHQGDVDIVRWHPNVHYIATGSSDRSVRLWDIRNGECVRILAGHETAITALEFSADGTTLGTADAAGLVSTWDLRAGQRKGMIKAHVGPIWSLAYSYGEGKLLVSGGSDCTVKLFREADDNIECVASWSTKATPVIKTGFTRRNLLFGIGPLSLQRMRSG